MPRKELGALGTKRVGKTSEGRPILANPDGSFSTERTTTILDAGQWYNIPTIFNGKAVSERQAVDIMRKNKYVDPDTGRQILGYKDNSGGKSPPKLAIHEAENRSKDIKMIFDKPRIGQVINE
jgi:hypothetical protein